MPPAKEAHKPALSGPHTAWAAGHGVVVLSTIYTLFKLVTFSTPSIYVYSIAYAGAVISWGIVVYKTLGIPMLNKIYLQRFLGDENGEYLLLALFWFFSKPVYISLLPFATFSLFHTLTFVRTTFLPPPSKTASTTGGQVSAQQPANISKLMQTWVKKNYEPAMRFVAYTEAVGILPFITFGVLLGRNTLLAPIFFAHFLRLRYFLSPQTRDAFGYLDGQIEKLMAHPSCPELVKKGLVFARQMILRYAQSVLTPPGTGAPPQAAQAAGPR